MALFSDAERAAVQRLKVVPMPAKRTKKTNVPNGDRRMVAAEKDPTQIALEKTRDEWIECLSRECFVSQEGGKTYVYTEGVCGDTGRNTLQRTRFVDFRDFHSDVIIYSHMNKAGEPVYLPLGEVWLKSSQRRQYSGIVMAPGKEVKGFYNLWKGFSVEPAEGSWKLMRDHIFNIICGGDDTNYQYIVNWIAAAIQRPGERAEVALVFRGDQGTGKGIVANSLCDLFGENSMHIFSGNQLTGRFNAHLRNVVLFYVDEALWAGDKQGEGILKGLITEPTLAVEAKGRDTVTAKNVLHIVMSSNSDWVIPAGMQERRYCVLDVSDERRQDKPYFKAIMEEMNNGGLAGMLYDLLRRDLSGFDIRSPPQTRGLFRQKLQSLDNLTGWYFSRLSEGELTPGGDWEPITAAALYNSYLSILSARSVHYRESDVAFGIALKKLLPAGYPRKRRHQVATSSPAYGDTRQTWHYHFPSLDICRKHFELLIKAEIDWEESYVQQE